MVQRGDRWLCSQLKKQRRTVATHQVANFVLATQSAPGFSAFIRLAQVSLDTLRYHNRFNFKSSCPTGCSVMMPCVCVGLSHANSVNELLMAAYGILESEPSLYFHLRAECHHTHWNPLYHSAPTDCRDRKVSQSSHGDQSIHYSDTFELAFMCWCCALTVPLVVPSGGSS